MAIHIPQNFYRQTITRAVTLTGATNIYVSTHPSPAEGYIAISPASAILREIIFYTAKGTDGNGTYVTVTLANRGLGGTTAQTHAIGEPVRMNVSAETIQEISDVLDQVVAAGAQDASTSTKGITRLSVAPVSATIPIAVGDNDTRVPTALITSSAGAADSGKVPKLNADGDIDSSFIKNGFGDGSDGDVTISSPTTLTRDMYYNNLVVNDILNTNNWRVFVRGVISGNGTIRSIGSSGSNGSNGAAGGGAGGGGGASQTGYFTTSTGSGGGAGRTSGGGGSVGTAGTAGVTIITSRGVAGAAGGAGGAHTGGGTPYAGGAGGAGGLVTSPVQVLDKLSWLTVSGIDITATMTLLKWTGSAGSGGGGGGSAPDGGSTANDGGGGGGGGGSGGIMFMQAKNWTGTFTISVAGGAGGNGGNGEGLGGGGGGGGGGSGGVAVVIYRTKTWTGSYTLTAGTGGAAGTGGTPIIGTNGTTGVSYEILAQTLIS